MLRDENDLKALLIGTLLDDFEIEREVAGRHIIEGQRVRADFLIRARSHILDYDITPEWIGIEVKFFNERSNHLGGKMNETFWQAVTYGQTLFKVGKAPFLEQVRPTMAFIFVNTRSIPRKHQDRFSALLSFCQYANVGQLTLSPVGYEFSFGGGFYFGKHRGDFRIGNTNLGVRRYIGNAMASRARG